MTPVVISQILVLLLVIAQVFTIPLEEVFQYKPPSQES